jgi:hypothetical protein
MIARSKGASAVSVRQMGCSKKERRRERKRKPTLCVRAGHSRRLRSRSSMAFQKWLGFRSSPRGSVPVKRRSLGGGAVSPSRGIACSRPTRRSVRQRPSRPSSLAGKFSRLRQRVPEGSRSPPLRPRRPESRRRRSGNETGRPGVEPPAWRQALRRTPAAEAGW